MPHNSRTQWLPGEVLMHAGKLTLLIRITAVVAVIFSWTRSTTSAAEVTLSLVVVLMCCGLILTWSRVAGFLLAHPSLVIADLVASAVLLSIGGLTSPLAVVFFSSAFLVGMYYEGTAKALLVVLACSLLLAASVSSSQHAAPAQVAAEVMGGMSIILLTVYVGTLLRRLQWRVDSIVELARKESRAAALGDERSRLARELHDSVTKTLVGIGLQASALKAVTPERAEPLQNIEQAAHSGVEQSRRILTDLRQSAAPCLRGSLQESLDEMKALYGQRIAFECPDVPGISSDVIYAVRKIAEEAVANSLKHADAGDTSVHAKSADGNLVMAVRDSGRGFRPGGADRTQGHYGLAGMRERAAALGGRLQILSTERRGTTVRLTVPAAVLHGSDPDLDHRTEETTEPV